MPDTTTDPLLDSVIQKIRDRKTGASTGAPKSVYEWALRFRRIDRRPFSLDRFLPLKAIYEDNHPRIVIMKPAQRGISEWAICLACFALEFGAAAWVKDGSKSGLNIAIIFPARTDLIDFSKERVANLKDESPHLAELFGDDTSEFDSLGFKQIGDSFLYLRGGYSKSGLRSFPCDLMILDEFDELDSHAVALASKRLNASLVKRMVMISTPSIPGRGIDLEYQASDKRVYQSQCPGCSEWTTYDFFRDVKVANESWDEWQKWSQARVEKSEVTLHCPSCQYALTDADRCAEGRWVSLQPEVRRTHGYHIPWWPWGFVDLQSLAHDAVSPNPSELDELFHSDLGLPYGTTGGQVTDEMLAQLSAGMPEGGLPEGGWRDTTMGIDVGTRLHYRISSVSVADGHVYVRAMDSVPNFLELNPLMLRYSVRMAVIDAEPELHAAIDFCEKWRGRALRSFYPSAPSALKGTEFLVKKDTYDVMTNRNMLLDRVYSTIASASERWPSQFTNDPEVIAHFKSSTRVKFADDDGQQHISWVHAGPDHFAHAMVFDLVARKTLPQVVSFTPAVGGTRPVLDQLAGQQSREMGRRLSSVRLQDIR